MAAGRIWGILLLGLCLAFAAETTEAEDRSYSIEDARTLAIRALHAGHPDVSRDIAERLLERDPGDFDAALVLARSHRILDAPGPALSAARAAHALAADNVQRFHAAMEVADAQRRLGHPLRAQIWLRRAHGDAPTPVLKRRTVNGFRQVQADTPWETRLTFGIAPSSNLNGGSESAVSIIEGVPIVGELTGAAQALSGIEATVDGTLGYRLSRSARHDLSLSSRLYLRRVALSEEAQALAHELPNSDLAAETGEIALRYGVAPEGWRGIILLEGALGQARYGGSKLYDYRRAGLLRRLPLAHGITGHAAASVEQRVAGGRADEDIYALRLGATKSLARGTHLSGTLSLRQQVVAGSLRSRSVAGELRYTLGKPVGPARVSVALGGSYTDYPSYTVGFIAVPGGRQDDSLFGDIDMTFPTAGYMGFAPHVRLRAARTWSNVSRYATRELSVSLGIKSEF